jgi:hypothetical protein
MIIPERKLEKTHIRQDEARSSRMSPQDRAMIKKTNVKKLVEK